MSEVFGELLKRSLDLLGHTREQRKSKEWYLNTCLSSSAALGDDWVGEFGIRPLPISQAFVPLRLADDAGRIEPLGRALSKYQRLVIQGQAGAGKSTLVKFITYVLAQALSYKSHRKDPDRLLGIPALFPLRIKLEGCEEGYSVYDLMMLKDVPGIQPEWIEGLLDRGGVLIMLDGLDEIVDLGRRRQVIDEIGHLTHRFASSFPKQQNGNRVLITIRTVSYRNRELSRFDYAVRTLQELADEQQRDLVKRYYAIWSEQEGEAAQKTVTLQKVAQLLTQLQENEGLRRLKSNPLLLSRIGRLHYQGIPLPGKRHELYHQCLEHLIRRRDPDARVKDWLEILGKLALRIQQEEGSGTLVGSEAEQIVERALRVRAREQEAGNAQTWLARAEEWNLLSSGRDESTGKCIYRFGHQSFQEYLAAYIVQQQEEEHWPVLRDNLRDDRWREVVLLYAAMPSRKVNVKSPLEMVIGELIGEGTPPHNADLILAGHCLGSEHRLSSRSRWCDLIVNPLEQLSYGNQADNIRAIEALCLIEPKGRQIVLDRILKRASPTAHLAHQQVMEDLNSFTDPIARCELRDALLTCLNERPRIAERILLAEALGRIGDTRLGQVITVEIHDDRQGKEKRLDVGRFPVTNHEYHLFIQAIGYQPAADWLNGQYPLNRANHPVTGISLQDARRYCEWLSTQKGHLVRLPSAEEWRAIVQGGTNNHYPWGDRFDQYYCNCRLNIFIPASRRRQLGSTQRVKQPTVWPTCWAMYGNGLTAD